VVRPGLHLATVPWFVRLGERFHSSFLPLCLFVVLYLPFNFLDSTGSLFLEFGMSNRRMLGTALLFSILPGYALFAQFHAWRVAYRTTLEFSSLSPVDAEKYAKAVTTKPGWWMPLVIVVGTLLGTYDFSGLSWLLSINNQTPFDAWFRLAAATAWAFVFWLLCWRLHCSLALYRLGERLKLDVYQLDSLDGFARVPLAHLLIVAGGLALMPLQSLDFQLQWINYRAGLIVGVPSMFLLVLPPILGLHRNMRSRIRTRLAELQNEINSCNRAEFELLSTLVEHRETVRSFRSWPLDVSLIGKLVFYLIIPPLAWVAAAFVERAVDALV